MKNEFPNISYYDPPLVKNVYIEEMQHHVKLPGLTYFQNWWWYDVIYDANLPELVEYNSCIEQVLAFPLCGRLWPETPHNVKTATLRKATTETARNRNGHRPKGPQPKWSQTEKPQPETVTNR